MTQVRDAALAWHDAGYTVLPAATDGTKRPLVAWQRYQTQPPTIEQITEWFTGDQPGLGLICGAASGGLEMLELEGRAVTAGKLAEFTELVTRSGLADLWIRLTQDGYAERTPAGGLHLLYRITDGPVPGNTKLARTTTGEVLAETRGEGGWVVIAPSHGPTHPSGQPWTLAYGVPGRVPTIIAAEREQLHRIVRCLDDTPQPAEPTPAPRLALVRDDGDLSPGDDYEARTDWADILTPHGWRLAFTRGATSYWRRPGKDTPGISATTGHATDRDRLYVFTTSTDFDAERPYTKFGAYALLEHGGNHNAAARELRRLGYGTPPAEAQAAAFTDLLPPARLAPMEGTAAPQAKAPAEADGPNLPVVDPPEPTLLERLRAALVTSSGLDDIPEPEPLISDVLYMNSVAWLIGAPGNGKSFVALDMAGCIATGEIWQGYRAEKGAVLYLAAEGVSGIKQRVRAWESAMGWPMAGVQFLPVAVQSANEHDWAAFVELARELRPVLIVVDTQARVTVGLEENSAKDMGEFVHRVERLRVASGACVLIVHHQGRSGDHMRGSTALEGAATTIIKVTKEDESVEIECTKQKDAPEFDKINLRLVAHDSSAILSLTEHDSTVHIGHPAVRRMLIDWWNSHETDWVSVSTLVDSKIAAKATFHRAKKPLERALLLEAKGEGGARRYRLLKRPDPA